MNVLHININYAERPLHQELVRALEKCGINNRVFCPTYDLGKCVVELDKNVDYKMCFKKQDRWFYFIKQKKIINAVDRCVVVKDADIIHAHTLFSDGNAAMMLGRKYKKPYVVAVRNTDINVFFKYKPWLIPLGIRIMRQAESVFFLSNAYKEKVLNGSIPNRYRAEIGRKCHVMPNGIDDFWHNNKGQQKQLSVSKSIRLLSVCEINRNKNILTTIEAMRKLEKNGIVCHLDVIGKIVDKTIYERVIASDSVSYSPPKDKNELIHDYRNADIFVMPSKHESFGLVYAEALSQGVPVLYTKGQGFDGLFKDGVVGYAIDCMNPEDIAEKICLVIDDYSEISKRCLDLSDRFSWEDLARGYVEWYREVKNGSI